MMGYSNPAWEFPNTLEEGSSSFRDDAESSPTATMTSRQGTADLTKTGTQPRDKERKDPKRGSSASTPTRDGVVGFFHDGTNDPSRATNAVTPSVRPTPASGIVFSAPATPKSASTLDAKSLLSPKTGKGTRDEPAIIDDEDEGADSGLGSMIEKLHRVEKRTEAPAKRRKLESANGDDDDDARKKPKFEIKAGSGVVTDFLNEEKQKGADEIKDGAGVAGAIDITSDDEEVHHSKEQLPDPNDKDLVCLGRIEFDDGRLPQALISNVPHLRPSSLLQPSATKWPPIPVRLVHEKLFLIWVVDPLRSRFAKLDAHTAKALAPLMEDARSGYGATFKAILRDRKRNQGEREGDAVSTSGSLHIKVYAYRGKARLVGNLLSHHRVWLRNCPVPLHEQLYNPHDPTTFLKTPERVSTSGSSSAAASHISRTVEEIRTDVLNMFDSIIRTEQLPHADQPKDVNTELLSHQKQALYFLMEREKDRNVPSNESGEGFSLWKTNHAANGKKIYYNVITGIELTSRPPSMLGGILADMMGLGKTLSMLSLVVSSMEEARQFAKLRPPPTPNMRLMMNARTTILVCPLSVVSNWEIQIKDHIRRKCLTYYIYHGSDRKQDLNELRDHDIIITSYHTIASEFKRQNSPLFSVHWFRVILDEAHIIRNPGTIMSAGACELAAERRWAVTGTPVQNRLDDLGSLIKFLRIKPFDEKGAFAQYILAPFKSADPHILPKLRLLVDSITLRRLKNNIDLPDRKDFIVRLDFSKEEKDIYTTFVADSRTKVRLLTGGDRLGGKTYAHILKAIMRLRLACAHGEELLSDDDRKLLEGLTKDKAIDLTDDDNDDAPKLSKKQAFEMLELLRQSDLDTCPRCNKRIENKVADDELSEDDEVRQDTDTIGHMTACYHIICPACFPKHEEEIEQLAQDDMMEKGTDGDVYTCPYCRQEGTKLAHYKILQSELDAEEAEKARIRANPKLAKRLGLYRGPHTKTLKLIEYLKKFEAESHENPSEEPIKSVVFSTWTNHLDLIQIALEANNIKYSRLDGSMSRKNRAAAIRTFTNDREITVILITVGAGGLGLNLTAANKVFVMEPQFNPQAEAQSVDRVHRLGQTREVEVIRLIMRDSFEENMLAQQKMKIDLADLAVNRNTKMDKAEAAKAKLESLRALFR